MSHFLCVVLVPKRTRTIKPTVARLLAPYDENRRVEPYISQTRDEVLAQKEEITKKVNSGEPLPDYLQKYKGKIEQMSLKEFAENWYRKGVDDEGNLLSDYPRGAKWDWYEIGGRWGGKIKNNICPVSKLPQDFDAFAIVTPEGEWHEEGKMGWWAMVTNQKDEVGWQLEQAALFEAYKECLAVCVDCHI